MDRYRALHQSEAGAGADWFWQCLQRLQVHPVSTFAHLRQECIVHVPSCYTIASFVSKLSELLRAEFLADVTFQLIRTQHGSSPSPIDSSPDHLYESSTHISESIESHPESSTAASIMTEMHGYSKVDIGNLIRSPIYMKKNQLIDANYTLHLINAVGLNESNLCRTLANIFSNLDSATTREISGPVVQSLNIERTKYKENSYHVSMELKTDETHLIDFESLAGVLLNSERQEPNVNYQGWQGSLQLMRRKCILFYSRTNISPLMEHKILIEDPAGIQEMLTASASNIADSESLVLFSQAVQRVGYHQALFFDGAEIDEDDNGAFEDIKKHIESRLNQDQATGENETTPSVSILGWLVNQAKAIHTSIIGKSVSPKFESTEPLMSLRTILDAIDERYHIDNVVIIHLDTKGLFNAAAVRSQLRIDATSSKLSANIDTNLENYHRFLTVNNILYDVFHLIGHSPSEVQQIYDSILDQNFPPRLKAKLEVAKTNSPPKIEDNTIKQLFNVTTTCHHKNMGELTELFRVLDTSKAILHHLDGINLIETFDSLATIEYPKNDTTIENQLIQNGCKSISKEEVLPDSSSPPVATQSLKFKASHVITICSGKITSDLLASLALATSKYVTQFSNLRQLAIAYSEAYPYAYELVPPHDPSKSSTLLLSSQPTALRSSKGRAGEQKHWLLRDRMKSKVDCIELYVTPDYSKLSLSEFEETLMQVGLLNGADVAVQQNHFSRTCKRVATFDMDSTLIQMECIDEMASYVGVGQEVKAITHKAMNGELDFVQALEARIALLKGAPSESLFNHVINNITYTPHVRIVTHTMEALGFDTAVLSGGFFPIILNVKNHLKLGHAHANVLEVDENGTLTGRLRDGRPIIDSAAKQHYLHKLCLENYVEADLSLAVGDGANDLKMLASSGVGIAFMAKDAVQTQTKFHINQLTFAPVLYFMGISHTDCLSILAETMPLQ